MSNIWQGYSQGAQNWNAIEFNSPQDLIPTGVFGKAVVPFGYGLIAINTSGVGQTVVTIPVGMEKTLRRFIVADFGGTAAGCNISISGLNGETFRYATQFVTASGTVGNSNAIGIPSGNVIINTNYGVKTFDNFNGTVSGWLAY